MVVDLDDTDRGILHALQENARDAPANEIAKKVGVSASTVRNRISCDNITKGRGPMSLLAMHRFNGRYARGDR